MGSNVNTGRRHATMVMVGCFLLLLSCGSASVDVESAANQPVEPDTPTPVATVEAAANQIVLPEQDGSFSDDTLVQCSGSPLFAAGALKTPILLADTLLADERAFDPLTEFLNSEEGVYWPHDGYWVLLNNEQSLLLAHVSTFEGVTLIGSQLDGDTWRSSALQSGGACPIQVPLSEGMHEVDWRLDPAFTVDSTATSVSLLATGQACSGGQAMEDRLQPPQVLATNELVYVVLVATYPEGAQNCPGNPEEPVVVELGEPLGDRSVVDGRSVAGVLTDYLPASPCGQIDPALVAEAEADAEARGGSPALVLDGPPDRTSC